MLVAPLQTRVEVVLTLSALSPGGGGGGGGLEVVVVPEVRVVYGESFNVGKMTEFLAGRIGNVGGGGGGGGKEGDDGKEGGEMGWDEAVLELYQRLLAKGKQKQ